MICGNSKLIIDFCPRTPYFTEEHSAYHLMKKMVGMNLHYFVSSLYSMCYSINDQCKKWSLCRCPMAFRRSRVQLPYPPPFARKPSYGWQATLCPCGNRVFCLYPEKPSFWPILHRIRRSSHSAGIRIAIIRLKLGKVQPRPLSSRYVLAMHARSGLFGY